MPLGLSQLLAPLRSAWSGQQSAPKDKQNNLQALNPKSRFVAASERETLEARRFACVCSIVVGSSGRGSGFLIAEDLVMTNYHVVSDKDGKLFAPSLIKCRFNFFTDGQYEDDEHNWIALPQSEKEAFVALSPTAAGDVDFGLDDDDRYLDPVTRKPLFDYAILKLTSPVGKYAGQTPLNPEVRPLGWIMMKENRTDLANRKFTVFQFPERIGTGGGFSQQSLQTSDTKESELIANGLRMKYGASTGRGSSGSPVFDDTTLVGLHNAGKENGGNTNNQFIPIDRILADLAVTSPALHAKLIGSEPPPIEVRRMDAGQQLSSCTQSAIDQRVMAAVSLIDRDKQNNLIQAKLRGNGPATVHVNHVLCRQNDDQVKEFIERIMIGVVQAEAKSAPDFIARYLGGSKETEGAAPPWRSFGLNWPAPNTPPQQAREEIANEFGSWAIAERTLLVYTVSDLAERSPDEERMYMEILGEECAKYILEKKIHTANAWQALQALVVYEHLPVVQVDLGRIAPLWTQMPPRHCGASFALPKVTRNDIEAWRTNINTAWKKSNTPIEIPAGFNPGDKFYMAEVIAMLKGPITNAAIAQIRSETEMNTP
ncbi:trypsin-like serine peptidase [Bradyrhizobium prioriisuperbiae]|uniref:trypsin-like serine peptidase n=1 Tax=Bradyrhizobium prioriisuperbiae TaxID=2854389 RepID=UPI0028E2C9F1|nr:trypsin-like peptidase domain-containing protein [Bradyrhizobium prioritasuperba]